MSGILGNALFSDSFIFSISLSLNIVGFFLFILIHKLAFIGCALIVFDFLILKSFLCIGKLKLCSMRDGGSTLNLQSGDLLSVRGLAEVKVAALRRGVWFRSLSRIERGIIDLTVRYVECIKSKKLAQVVGAIVEKLQTSLESLADRLVRTVGLPLAQKISNIAVSWGNRLASLWALDRGFARYLVFCTRREG